MPNLRSTRVRLCGSFVALTIAAFLATPAAAAKPGNTWSIEILSSAPDQVSGGDALVRVGFPGAGAKGNARLLLNGVDVTSQLAVQGGELVGVVQGFVLGMNVLQLKPSANANAVKAQLTVINHPISGPIFSGP